MELLNKIKTAWQSKKIAAALSALGLFLTASYGLDITPITSAVEQIWGAVAALFVVLGVTAVGVDKQDE